jgi:hypothetical protein
MATPQNFFRPALTILTAAMLTTTAAASSPYVDVSENALPLPATDRRSMDVEMADLDGDGDLDILVAMEFSKNLLLLNRGNGTFEDASDRLPAPVHDSEDIALGDFDADGDIDAVVVAEDDRIDLYYRNDGRGHFTSAKLPVAEVTNGVAKGDVDGDGDEDLITGNAGPNALWRNHDGTFVLSADSVPAKTSVSQDVQLADIDGDGDLDLVEANEGDNRILINDGSGQFTERADVFADTVGRESRQAALGDVDNDGDLDVVFGNVSLGYLRSQSEAGKQIGFANRLFLNDGEGNFIQSFQFPREEFQTPHIDLLDLDHDGDLDVLATDVLDFRQASNGRVRVYLNDGTGAFADKTDQVFPPTFVGNGWDAAIGDVNGDGKPDIYLANRFGEDRLLWGKSERRGATGSRCVQPALPLNCSTVTKL